MYGLPESANGSSKGGEDKGVSWKGESRAAFLLGFQPGGKGGEGLVGLRWDPAYDTALVNATSTRKVETVLPNFAWKGWLYA